MTVTKGALLLSSLCLASGTASALSSLADSAAWRFVGLPKKPPTQFHWEAMDGGPALRIEAQASYGNLVHAMPPATTAGTLHWQWRVDELNHASDLTRREGDDTTLKVCALFELPIERVPFLERQALRFARAVSREPLPAASVCYVWDAHLAAGTTLDNAFSRRVRYVVAQGPSAPLHRWLDEHHDIAADFLRLFGDESPGEVPPLVAVAVGADADNTRGRSVGFVRALRWSTP